MISALNVFYLEVHKFSKENFAVFFLTLLRKLLDNVLELSLSGELTKGLHDAAKILAADVTVQ